MNIRKKLEAIPGSYDDFVNSTERWMEQDDQIKNSILKQFETDPDSSYADIMNILCERLGIGEPVELVDEDQYESGFDDAPISNEDDVRAAY